MTKAPPTMCRPARILLALTLAAAALACASCAIHRAPAPYGPLPSAAQAEWQKMEMNMFCHFGPNTFTGEEWGSGREEESVFAPAALDCDQWAAVAKAAGFGGIIITAKHHDGFCLWPSTTSTHSVASSRWRDGQGDVLRELSDACRRAGLKFGVYISPWDRNSANYGTPAYNEEFRRTLEDVHTRYGDIFEQWFDGANGEGPNGRRQAYDWSLFNGEVARLHPGAVIFSDIGPGCRWVGNEQGKAPETCWSRMDTAGKAPGHAGSFDSLGTGYYDGGCWIPAEADVSIRPGWFWKQAEEPKSVEQLADIYLRSVGHNALLLLNVPPDTRGRIDARDSVRLVEFRRWLDTVFGRDLAPLATIKADSRRGARFGASRLTDGRYRTCWATADTVRRGTVELGWSGQQTIRYVVLQEYIPLGQRVSRFHIEAQTEEGWRQVAEGTTIGYKKIVPLGGPEGIQTDKLRVVIDESRACVVMNAIEAY